MSVWSKTFQNSAMFIRTIPGTRKQHGLGTNAFSHGRVHNQSVFIAFNANCEDIRW
jgi:hypothetical protein